MNAQGYTAGLTESVTPAATSGYYTYSLQAIAVDNGTLSSFALPGTFTLSGSSPFFFPAEVTFANSTGEFGGTYATSSSTTSGSTTTFTMMSHAYEVRGGVLSVFDLPSSLTGSGSPNSFDFVKSTVINDAGDLAGIYATGTNTGALGGASDYRAYVVHNGQIATFDILNGGTANGGQDTDQSPNTITIDVTPVNDAPSGSDKTITTLEDTAYAFAMGDFGFSDPNDTPPNTLQAVKITTLPNAGTLTDNGAAVIAGQFVGAGDLRAAS